MCGIVGSIATTAPARFAEALEILHHRGPDAGTIEQFAVAGWTVSFGHRRLSILDLTDAANQPFTSACGNSIIVYNGEIYNHATLRASLAAAGHAFRTRSDTEVLLAGLMMEGASFIKKLNGMFAFAMLDKAGKRLLLARDPFGIKPLYFHRRADGGLIFASEIRALAAAADLPLDVDADYLPEFLLNGFLYEPASGYSRIEKVPPGHAYDFDLADRRMTVRQVHDPLADGPGSGSLDDLLRHQVSLEIEADVPVGVFFSGGVDSSVLVAAAPRQVDAFFVDYGAEQDGDSRYVQAVADALGTPLKRASAREEDLTADQIVEEFKDVARGTEEPISDYTYIATRIISRLAREAGYKVMLSGMGGDELFAGYPRYTPTRYWPTLHTLGAPLGIATKLLERLPKWSKRAARLRTFLTAPDFAQAYTALVGYFSVEEIERMTGKTGACEPALDRIRALLEPVRNRSPLRQAMYLDRYGFLSHNLTVTDRASMAESIEVRVPLLNPDLDAFVSGQPDRDLLRGRSGKRPLKDYLAQRLPADLIHRPKVGFNPPLDGRIAKIGRERCEEIITSGKMSTYIDPAVTRTWIGEHFEGRANNTYRLWQLIYLSLWLDTAQ